MLAQRFLIPVLFLNEADRLGKISLFDYAIVLRVLLMFQYPLNYRYFLQTGVTVKVPRMVSLETTAACQLACKMCDRSSLKRETIFMTDEVFKAAIKNIAPYRIKVSFNGIGEPLLDRNLPDRIAYACSQGIDQIGMVTNGLLLTPRIAGELIAAGIKRITISLDGSGQHSHESGHSGADYETVAGNIEGLVSLKKKLSADSLDVILRVTVQKSNLAVVPNIFMRWQDKVTAICVNFVYQYGNAITESVLPYRWQERVPCPKLLSAMMVLTNGDATICCLGDVNAELRIGNIATDKLEEFYTGPIARNIRAKHLAKDFVLLPVCQRCVGCTMSNFHFGALARTIETECREYVKSACPPEMMQINILRLVRQYQDLL